MITVPIRDRRNGIGENRGLISDSDIRHDGLAAG
ncbi:hypothetical protein K227x_41170 [Rubripirellula lacrimiformis]|uniref:Uncharacterized protein n=1 Tax=Rubripirellula lacrimiformis TaxID=1930273 RepID=A0A517NF06_9BACT|nr:hypothetical protein K227x_41170 [Rubripirellula lacrimiformis]